MPFPQAHQLCSFAGLDTGERLFIWARGAKDKGQEDLTVFIANLARSTIAKVFPVSPVTQASASAVHSSGLGATQRANAAQLAQQLHYCVLQDVLQKRYPLHEVTEGRFTRSVIPDPEEVHRMLRVPDFHLGLLTCSLELVSAAVLEQHVLLSTPAKIGSEHSMLTVWHAASCFQDCFAHGGQDRPWMSASGLACLAGIKQRCEEELVLADKSHFFEIYFVGGGSLYPGACMDLISSFIVALGDTAINHTMVLVHSIATHNMSGLTVAPQAFILACAELMDKVLSHRLDLFFGRHVGTLIICCIYGIAKVLNATIAFRSVVLQAAELLPSMVQGKRGMSAKEEESLINACRTFYNTVFLKSCERMIRAAAKVQGSQTAENAGAGHVIHAMHASQHTALHLSYGWGSEGIKSLQILHFLSDLLDREIILYIFVPCKTHVLIATACPLAASDCYASRVPSWC